MATPKALKNNANVQVVKSKTHQFTPQTIYYVILVLAWTGVSLVTSQLFLQYLLSWLVGAKLATPFWTCVFYALTYLMTLALVLYVAPRTFELYRKQHPKNNSNAEKDNNSNNPLASSPAELGLQRLPTFVDIGLAPIGYFVAVVSASFMINLMQIFPWFQANETQDTGFSFFLTSSDRIFALLAIVIIAPIAEEIIMRGWLYGKLRSRLKVLPAILLVSILFGFLHGQWNVAVSTFVLSAVLCSLREITGTIWSGMLVHILQNGIAFYLLYCLH